MFALVESGTITQFPKGNKGITIGDNQYPRTIYSYTLFHKEGENKCYKK